MRFRTWLIRAAAAAALAMMTMTCGVREDELRCEEAAAHLAECCAGFMPSILDCTFVPADGCSPPHEPSISIENSRCIDGLSCEQINKTDLCNRIVQAVQTNNPVTCP